MSSLVCSPARELWRPRHDDRIRLRKARERLSFSYQPIGKGSKSSVIYKTIVTICNCLLRISFWREKVYKSVTKLSVYDRYLYYFGRDGQYPMGDFVEPSSASPVSSASGTPWAHCGAPNQASTRLGQAATPGGVSKGSARAQFAFAATSRPLVELLPNMPEYLTYL
jgi:hypothetical protein